MWGEKMEQQFFQIGELAEQIGKHQNTVDGWFKKLEEQEIHYISRNNQDQKVYDTSDLQIASFILERREKRYSLDAIFDELKEKFELRPFPLEENPSTELDLKTIENKIMERVRKTVQEENKMLYDLLSKQNEEIIALKQTVNERMAESSNNIKALLEVRQQEAAAKEEKKGFFARLMGR